MERHEKTAFYKFFFTYFISVAILILAVGFFYFQQMRLQLLKEEHFSLIEYARDIKHNSDISKFSKDYHHNFVVIQKHISIENFTVTDNEFMKYIPTNQKWYYMQVFKSKKSYEIHLRHLKYTIVGVQLFLLFLFGVLSFFLAKNALKPLRESIVTLDKFAKDLIHDLNTPVSAMKLNLTILQKNHTCKELKPFVRLEKSVESIVELQKSLTVLLENKTFQITSFDLCQVLFDVIELHKNNTKGVVFYITCKEFVIDSNKEALRQILDNLIANAVVYNKPNGYVKVFVKNKTLYIEDSGIGIEKPTMIFQRNYSEQNSSGLGLDIVKRLCEATNIKISATSDTNGTTFLLEFR